MTAKNFLLSRVVNEREEVAQPIKIELTPRAQEIVRGLKDRTGITQKAAVERVLSWFAMQPDSVRDALLSPTGDASAELAKLKMAELVAHGVAGPIQPVTMDQALSVIRLMADRIAQIDEVKTKELKEHLQKKKGK